MGRICVGAPCAFGVRPKVSRLARAGGPLRGQPPRHSGADGTSRAARLHQRVYRKAKVTIAAISGMVPSMFKTRVRSWARTDSAISAASFGSVLVRKVRLPCGLHRTERMLDCLATPGARLAGLQQGAAARPRSKTVVTLLKWDVSPKADLAELHGALIFINAEAALLGRLKTACRPTRVDCLHPVPPQRLLDLLALRTFERQKVGMGGTRFDPGQHHPALTLRAAWPIDGKH